RREPHPFPPRRPSDLGAEGTTAASALRAGGCTSATVSPCREGSVDGRANWPWRRTPSILRRVAGSGGSPPPSRLRRLCRDRAFRDRKSTRLNSSHQII